MAIVVPNVEAVKTWAVSNNVPGTLTVLCNNQEVKQLVMSDMIALGKEAGLKSFEQVKFFEKPNRKPSLEFEYFQVKDIYLHPDPFSVQNQLLTPTFKSRRPQIRNYFKPQLDDMYKTLD